MPFGISNSGSGINPQPFGSEARVVTCPFVLVMAFRYQDGGKSRLTRFILHKVYVVERPGTRLCRRRDAPIEPLEKGLLSLVRA